MTDTSVVKGRHDPCVVPRAPPVVDALVALTIADQALNWLVFIKPTSIRQCQTLKKLRNRMDSDYI